METRSGIDTLFSLVKILALSKMLSPCLYCIYQMHDNNEVFFYPKRDCKFLTDHQEFSLIVDSNSGNYGHDYSKLLFIHRFFLKIFLSV